MSTVVRPNYGTKGTDNITDLAELEGLLSPFQVEKLTYFFNQFFDFNEDGKIDAADFAGLNERLRKVAGWGEEDQEYINMVDNNRVFFECLLEQVLAERNKEGLEERSWDEALAPSKVVVDSVSLSSWLHMWARMCKGSAGIDDFPIWVQLIPRVIFNVICSKMRVDYITRESLRNFYENFSGLGGDNLEKVATEGYRSMSAVSSSFFSTISSLLTFRMGIMNWTTKATSSFSQTSSLEEQSMDLASTSLAASTTGT